MTPQQEAIAFRIWAHCEPLGWDVTIPDIAEALDLTKQRVIGICVSKGWVDRFRKVQYRRFQPKYGMEYGLCGIESLDDYIK